MLLSDGVAEARDAQGQLFGFERIEAMLRQSITAAEVATVAQAFGQQDDISVMRVVRAAKAAERTRKRNPRWLQVESLPGSPNCEKEIRIVHKICGI